MGSNLPKKHRSTLSLIYETSGILFALFIRSTEITNGDGMLPFRTASCSDSFQSWPSPSNAVMMRDETCWAERVALGIPGGELVKGFERNEGQKTFLKGMEGKKELGLVRNRITKEMLVVEDRKLTVSCKTG